MIFHILKTAFLASILAFPAYASAQNVFIHNDDFKITIPDGIKTAECETELAVKAGDGCIRLQTDSDIGVIFFRQNEGYDLMGPGALENHIQESVAALSDIPNIEVKNARTLEAATPMGVLELLRYDAAVADVVRIANPPITQTSILIPCPHKLGQMFIYLPAGDEQANHLLETLINSAPQYIEVLKKPEPAPESAHSGGTGILPSGSLSLLPRALLWGGAAALTIILILHLCARRRKKARENDEN